MGLITVRTRKFKNNALLGRKQFVVDVIHPQSANVSKADMKEKLASAYKVKDTKQIVLFGFHTEFGGGKSSGMGLIYESVDKSPRTCTQSASVMRTLVFFIGIVLVATLAAHNNEYSAAEVESDARVQPLQELTPFMAPPKEASVPYGKSAVPTAMDPELFEDDPLANEPMQPEATLSGRAQDFEIAFQRLKEEDPEDVVDEIETVPAETDVFTETKETNDDEIRPSLPIRDGQEGAAGTGDLDKETDSEVKKEANVAAIGQDIEEAKKSGQQLAAVDKAKETKKEGGDSGKKDAKSSAPATTDKQNKHLAKEGTKEKVAVHKEKKSAAGSAYQMSLATLVSTVLVALAFGSL